MSHNHDHNHDHEVITLVDEQGNETLFEILLTIDGREEFGKTMFFWYQPVQKKMLTERLKFKLILSLKMKMVPKVTFNQSLKTQMLNGI